MFKDKNSRTWDFSKKFKCKYREFTSVFNDILVIYSICFYKLSKYKCSLVKLNSHL